MDNIVNFTNLMEENETLRPLADYVELIMGIPEEQLNENSIEVITGMMQGAITDTVLENAIQSLLDEFKTEGYAKKHVKLVAESIKNELEEYVNELHPSEAKLKIINSVFEKIYFIFDKAAERYHSIDFILPISLDEGAQLPQYAHEEDAAADLYAADTVTIPAHSTSTMVRTGVHIALPEGWMAMIFPRSSIGAKTGLRLSNSAGIIDSNYRGPLGVLYDNIADSDYTIYAGERIAQLLVFPSYHFKGVKVDILDTTNRGEGGFGSTGK